MYFRDQNIMQRGDSTKLNFEGLEMQKLNIPTDRAQKKLKNGVICLVIMVISRVMIIKMSRMTIFLYVLLMTTNN